MDATNQFQFHHNVTDPFQMIFDMQKKGWLLSSWKKEDNGPGTLLIFKASSFEKCGDFSAQLF